MEIEKSPQHMAKKLWNIVRIVFFMMRKGIAKSKIIMVDLQILLKRGKIASKAIRNLILRHHNYYSALTCRSDDVNMAFIAPREYEFSCSNTPLVYNSKRKNHQSKDELKVMQKVFNNLNHYDAVEASPLTLPGFGRTPRVRQLRVTDSPFSVKDAEDNHQVDKDAEEFIKKFYKDLKNQRRIAAFGLNDEQLIQGRKT